jgi:hypothetical protein
MRVGSLFGMLDMDRLANTGCASLDGVYTSTEYLLQRSRCFTVPRMGNRYPVGAFHPSGIDIDQRTSACPLSSHRGSGPDPRKALVRRQRQLSAVLVSNRSVRRTHRASDRRLSSPRLRLRSQIPVHGRGEKPPSQSVHVWRRSLWRDSAFTASSI